MKKIVLLTFVLLSSCVAGLLELQIASAYPYTNMDVDTVYNMITNGSYPDLVVLDVRRQDEYDDGHIYGATWIPHTELEARIGELADHENHEIIVYCRSGVRSVIASEILDSHNFTKVYNMVGGIQAWQSAGYPVWIATIHNVDTTFNYDTIQAAIDAPQTLDGHTILVDAGTYYEHVVLNKSLSLIGENRDTTIIDGNGTDTVVDVKANNLVITGFTTQTGEYGIRTYYSFNCSIRDNKARNNEYGIRLYYSSNCSISGNNAHNNNRGIQLWYSSNCSVFDNNANNNEYGIQLHGSSDNILRNNSMTDNSYNFDVVYGFPEDIDVSNTVNGKPIYYWVNQHDMKVPVDAGYVAAINSTNVTLEDLALTNNGQGVLFDHTTNSTIKNVTATNNWYGIKLRLSSDCSVSENNASNNHRGIYLELSNNNSIVNNCAFLNGEGITLFGASSNNYIAGNNVSRRTSEVLIGVGILLYTDSEFNTIVRNNVTYVNYGVFLDGSSWNNVAENFVSKCYFASIKIYYGSWNNVTENIIAESRYGIELHNANNNTIYHNNFIDNTEHVYIWTAGIANFWDDGYPSGGNYWSDYNGTDLLNGPYQNETGSDGIGDAPHILDADNQDRYPLITTTIFRVGPSTRFGVVWEGEIYYVNVISNSTVEKLQFMQSGKLITFNITGPSETIGYCNVTIPKDLLKGEPWTLLVDGSPPTPEPIMTSNTTHTFLYFTYSHSRKTVEIRGTDVIPEFPTGTSMLLILIVLTVAIAIYNRRLLKT